jgi:hypothetical protein
VFSRFTKPQLQLKIALVFATIAMAFPALRSNEFLGLKSSQFAAGTHRGRYCRCAFLRWHEWAAKEPHLRAQHDPLDCRGSRRRPTADRDGVECGAVPTPDRHAIPLYVAASARLQGWDAYSQAPFAGMGNPSNWHAFNDAALLATLPAAALLYRRNDVREVHTNYVFAPTPGQLFNHLISLATSVALRTAAEKGKLTIAMPRTRKLPWLEESHIPAGAKGSDHPSLSIIDHEATEVVADTGELRRNSDQGIYMINAPRTQAAMGSIGDKRIALADVEIAVTTRNATVAVQSTRRQEHRRGAHNYDINRREIDS